MSTLIEHEGSHAKTYASHARAVKAITEKFGERHMRYLIVKTEDDRYQPIIISAGDYPLIAYTHNRFFVCGV
jgi:hypothetical protein